MKYMANEDVIELAKSINTAMDVRTKPLHSKIERLEKQQDYLLSIIQNALVSLAIIQMPCQEDNLANVVTNEDLLKVMADSFRQARKKAVNEMAYEEGSVEYEKANADRAVDLLTRYEQLEVKYKRLKEIIFVIKRNIKAGAVTTQWIEKFITEQALGG